MYSKLAFLVYYLWLYPYRQIVSPPHRTPPVDLSNLSGYNCTTSADINWSVPQFQLNNTHNPNKLRKICFPLYCLTVTEKAPLPLPFIYHRRIYWNPEMKAYNGNNRGPGYTSVIQFNKGPRFFEKCLNDLAHLLDTHTPGILVMEEVEIDISVPLSHTCLNDYNIEVGKCPPPVK